MYSQKFHVQCSGDATYHKINNLYNITVRPHSALSTQLVMQKFMHLTFISQLLSLFTTKFAITVAANGNDTSCATPG